jgi:uncharacterized protein (DUF2249 family)
MNRQAARIVELDVRPHLRKKLEPFQIIMDTVKTLEESDIFVLHATFKPTPLFGVLKLRGLTGKTEQKETDHWISTFVSKKYKIWLEEDASSEEAESSDTSTASGKPHVQGGSSGAKIIELDNRGLEPPQPMIRTLAALEKSRPGDEVVIHNDRVPVFLIEELNSLGCLYAIEEQADGSAKVNIRKR